MKLCYVLPKYDSKAPEHFRHTLDMLKELAKHTELTVIIEKASGTPRIPGASTRVIKSRFPLTRYLQTKAALAEEAKRGCRCFYIHYSYYGIIAAAAVTRRYGGKTYYWNCGLPSLFHKRWGKRGVLSAKLLSEWPLRLALSKTDYLVTGTPRMKEYYHKVFAVPANKILVVPNDISLSRFKPASLREEKSLLFVHHLSPRKGADQLVAIMKLLPGAELTVIGSGPYSQTLQKEKLASMHLLGAVANEEVSRYFQRCTVFIMPSMEEGFPRVLLECMATGTPFVATDVGGVKDIVPKEALRYVVPYGKPKLFAAAVQRLLSSPKERRKLSAAGLAHVKRYDTAIVVKKLLGVLKP